jgi:signal peptide peptidase SppA
MDDLVNEASPTPRAGLLSYLPASWINRGPLVPVLRFSGPIGVVTPLRPGLSLSTSAAAIDKAFSMRGAKAVAIQINSPGGSPVQSMLIYRRIRALAAEKGLKVYVFAEDVAASGGYLLALAGDEIYADPSSIVGSIGVITATFGLNEMIAKIGVQRRVYTAGKSKDTLDPFLPEKPEDVERIKSLQRDVHAAFIDLVKERRGPKIANAGDELFTGEFWSGKRALELGLIDGLGDVRGKMRETFGDDVRLKLVMPSTSWLRRRRSVFAEAGALDLGFLSGELAADLISAIEARALWSRFGL